MSNSEKSEADEDVQHVNRTDTGASIEATLKRGESTRNEDRIKIKGKGESAEEAAEEFEYLLKEYEEEYSTRLRDIQPSQSGESDGERA